jgi:CheY-like chemotaxis protein
MMPNKDGLETIMHLKRTWPSTRIIATSGGMQKTDPNFVLRMAKNLGADAVFPKPFRLKPFTDLVAEVLAAPADLHP